MCGGSCGVRLTDVTVRLLIFTQYFWPENFRVNDLVGALVARGHHVTVLTGLPNYPDGDVFAEFQAEPRAFSHYRGAHVVRVPLLARRQGAVRLVLNYASFVLTGATIGAWRLRGQRFDAVFVYQPSPITACLPALVVGRITGAPVLLWTLDLWPETLQAIGVVTSPRLLRLVGRLVSFIYRRCALILGQSRGFEANVVRYAGDPAKFRYFPQWAEPLFGSAEGSVSVAPEVAPFVRFFNVLFAGNIGDAQDFPSILEAASRLRHRSDIRWLIVGDGRTANWVREEVARRDLADHVILLGRHPIERMPEFFLAASALLVSLKRDPVFALTIPGKVQSYLAAGIPVLGMLDGDGARVIEDAGAGMTCSSGDGATLASLVEQMAALSSDERRAMGARGRAYSHREFDREVLLTQLEAWIAELRPVSTEATS
jgi:colanic acid biosynthesis glycosyl transferase WcaI